MSTHQILVTYLPYNIPKIKIRVVVGGGSSDVERHFSVPLWDKTLAEDWSLGQSWTISLKNSSSCFYGYLFSSPVKKNLILEERDWGCGGRYHAKDFKSYEQVTNYKDALVKLFPITATVKEFWTRVVKKSWEQELRSKMIGLVVF